MVRIQYVGYPSKFYGKHLMKILANLKDFGVGRMVTRGSYENYPKPCFYIIKKVEPAMDDETIWGDVHAQEYFQCVDRGVRVIKSHLPDFRLVAKGDEQKFLHQIISDPPVAILQRERDFPPLLKMLVQTDMEARGELFNPNIKMPAHYKLAADELSRIAKPGETPTVTIDSNKSPIVFDELKKGVNFDV